MNGVLPQHRVELLNFDALGRVLAVLRRNVTGSSSHAGVLVLCALEDNLYAVAFLGHLT